ncbi:hypothetical protein GGX14DRAFT_570291 [Mycena pura]|uniref:Uncharacterized protein n=1 Tax=Mycena pura TaxID=153505 RepID=A0AAD6YAV6_9AGAR|nr:hypothetical protein GGX14DRAFT_570291 [Mycena pura]
MDTETLTMNSPGRHSIDTHGSCQVVPTKHNFAVGLVVIPPPFELSPEAPAPFSAPEPKFDPPAAVTSTPLDASVLNIQLTVCVWSDARPVAEKKNFGIDGLGSGGCENFFGPPRGVCRTPLIAKFVPAAARALLLPLQVVSPPRGARGVPRNYTVWNAPGLSIGGAAFNEKVVVSGPATKNQAAYVPLCPRDDRLRPRARRRRGLSK